MSNENVIRAWAVKEAGGKLERYDFDAGELGADDVEIKVEYCGVCHSDLSMMNNEWGMSSYPLVPGHEAVGEIIRMGSAVKGLKVGQKVGIGWTSESCQHCNPCIGGHGNYCPENVPTIAGNGRHQGGFADKMRAQWQWVIPLPGGIDMSKAGPLLCGGITVFEPLLQHNINASHKVGVIGIGGLGHMAIDFFNKWSCEVIAFSSTPDKYDEIRAMGAHNILNSRDPEEFAAAAGTFDLIVSTVSVKLDWNAYLRLLKPQGKLHIVGATLDPMDINAFALIAGERGVAGSATGSPVQLRTMIEFAARKGVLPITENFNMSEVNEAMEHLEAGKARYRIVLKNDFE